MPHLDIMKENWLLDIREGSFSSWRNQASIMLEPDHTPSTSNGRSGTRHERDNGHSSRGAEAEASTGRFIRQLNLRERAASCHRLRPLGLSVLAATTPSPEFPKGGGDNGGQYGLVVCRMSICSTNLRIAHLGGGTKMLAQIHPATTPLALGLSTAVFQYYWLASASAIGTTSKFFPRGGPCAGPFAPPKSIKYFWRPPDRSFQLSHRTYHHSRRLVPF